MKACERGHPLDTGLHVDAARMDEPRVPEDDRARVPRDPVSFEVVGQLVHILKRLQRKKQDDLVRSGSALD